MNENTAALLVLSLQALQQAQAYQKVVTQAALEGRGVTDEERNAAEAEALAAIDNLKKA